MMVGNYAKVASIKTKVNAARVNYVGIIYKPVILTPRLVKK